MVVPALAAPSMKKFGSLGSVGKQSEFIAALHRIYWASYMPHVVLNDVAYGSVRQEQMKLISSLVVERVI